MREDMAKVIVERPRSGSSWTSKRPRKRWHKYPMDEWPTKESHKRELRGIRNKSLNENLAPLRRFLRSHVGKPWNEVNSEMRERINLNSAVQLHIWQHVQQYVCVDPVERDGKLLDNRGHELRRYFYVEPGSGILREVPFVRRIKKKSGPRPFIRIDRWTVCRKLDGVWFIVTLRPLPEDLTRAWDVVFKQYCKQITEITLREFHCQDGYAVSKQQLNKKEIAWLKSKQMWKKNRRKK